jgi:hypothetical protein
LAQLPKEPEPSITRFKPAQIFDGKTDVDLQLARQHKVMLAWGTDFLFDPAQNKNQNTDILQLQKWFTHAVVAETPDPRPRTTARTV